MEGLLRDRGVAEADLAEVMDRLSVDGAIDDERFAKRYAEDKREISGWGPERIRHALQERGLGADLIDLALAAEPREQQVERAVAFLDAKGVDTESPDQRRKATAMLARRGFESEVVYDALREHERTRRDGGASG